MPDLKSTRAFHLYPGRDPLSYAGAAESGTRRRCRGIGEGLAAAVRDGNECSCLASFLAVLAKKLSHRGFAHLAFRNHSHSALELWTGGVERDSVQLKKDECSDGARSLVAIDERVFSRDVEEIGRSHLKKIGVEILIAKPCPGQGHRRFQETHVSDA